MKRILFMTAAMLLLVAGVTLAQTPTTSAPGPTLQREPGEANNNLPNPGNPQAEPTTATDTDATADQNPNDAGTATDTTGTMGTTDTTTGATGVTDATDQDADVTGSDTTTDNRRDTTTPSTGVGATDTTDTDTDTMGATDTTTGGGMSDDASLPDTGSELPLLGLAGLLALGAAAGLRQINS